MNLPRRKARFCVIGQKNCFARAAVIIGGKERGEVGFNYDLDFKTIDFRARPDLYRVGVGEQGVLLVEPYKSEILPHWRFRTPEIARESAQKIYELFQTYREAGDFVGMDMARKFLQMGYTRARRYANHPSGRKYQSNPQAEGDPERRKAARAAVLPQAEDWADSEKAQSAAIFYAVYEKAKDDPRYVALREEHLKKYGK